jgi:hypothetical protein
MGPRSITFRIITYPNVEIVERTSFGLRVETWREAKMTDNCSLGPTAQNCRIITLGGISPPASGTAVGAGCRGVRPLPECYLRRGFDQWLS